MVEEAIYRKTLLRSGGGFYWALAVCIRAGFRLQYLQGGQCVYVNEPRYISSALCFNFSGNTERYIVSFSVNISSVDM